MPHFPHHLALGVIALVVTLAISGLTVNRLVQRKLRLSTLLLALYVLFHLLVMWRPDLLPPADGQLRSFERLALTASLINLIIVSIVNPLRADRVPDRFPSIVQDAMVIGLLILIATFAFGDEFLATSAVSAVVIGLALQDTLGNAFAGLAIQSEKPFNVGHWVAVGEHEGRVAEVTWRATKLRTKSGNFVILPNSEVAKAPVINYSEPAAPTRLFVEIGVSYDTPPNRARAVLHEALSNCPLVLKAPAPDVVFAGFGDFSLNFKVRFWVEDFERDEVARDQVRTAVYYALRRRGIEIPFPVTTEIQKNWEPPDERARTDERDALIARVDLLSPLNAEQRRLMAGATTTLSFADGETIVQQGAKGDAMYVICSGQVAVTLPGQAEPLAVLRDGGYFGEMAVLTGETRTANVVAKGDVVVLEITADAFRQLAAAYPHVVEQIGVAAATRRVELEHARAASSASAVVDAPSGFLDRMRRFLRMA